LRELAQQFGGADFGTEGASGRTLKLLLTRPGELTAPYLAGRRCCSASATPTSAWWPTSAPSCSCG